MSSPHLDSAPDHAPDHAPDRVFVYYPRGDRTGGPEALHQLVDAMRTVGLDASLVPMRGTEHLPRVEQYAHYDAPEVDAVTDEPGSWVVFPEVYLSPIRALQHARPVCWWLSIDKSALWKARTELENRRRLGRSTDLVLQLRLFKQVLVRRRWVGRMQDPRVLHVAQSDYAVRFLAERMGLEAQLVSDYLPGVDPEATDADPPAPPPTGSRPTVCFQPAKGGELVAAVQDVLGDAVSWTALQGLDAAGVRRALDECQVYLDLGHQPGKDRMPREAALAGSVTLVARVGAGSSEVDVPLPQAHKIAYTDDVARVAADVLTGVLGDLDAGYAAQAPYRAAIRDERRRFHAEVATAFRAPGQA